MWSTVSRNRFLWVSTGLLSSAIAAAQSTHIKLRILDGKTGKAIEAQHLIVFAGGSPNDVQFHKVHLQTFSDKNGNGNLDMDQQVEWIQVWVDGKTLCQSNPNSQSFNIKEILSHGAATPNTCSAFVVAPIPGELVIYARPRSLREKMEQ